MQTLEFAGRKVRFEGDPPESCHFGLHELLALGARWGQFVELAEALLQRAVLLSKKKHNISF